MAKPKPKLLIPLKHEFVPALENFMQESLNLYFAADQVAELLPPHVQEVLKRRLVAWKAAWSSDEEE